MDREINGNIQLKVPEIKYTKLFINGRFLDSVSGKTFETNDPRTGDVIAAVAEGDKEDVDNAVKAAREAFDHGKWPRTSGHERGRILMKLADLIEQHAEELSMLDAINAGKLLHMTQAFDIPTAAFMLRYFAGWADKVHGQTLKCSGEFQAYTLLEPVGVVGLIIPWNFPTAGVPDGVLNVVTGFGPTAGAAVASHMDVDAVSFTGSTEIGKVVMAAAASSNLKQVSLELGGKSPLVIFADADLDMAVQLAWQAVFFNKGEICLAGSRVYVQEEIYEEFKKKTVEMVKNWVLGDPFDPQVHQGPQVDKRQFEKVLRYIEAGKREGATLINGGKPVGEKGYFIEPTIFADVKEDMLIAKDEIFGPVMSIMKFKTIEEAIEKANNTRYGLAAGIVTKDLNIANMVSRSIRAGTIWINCYMVTEGDAPFGGYKMSGFGKDSGLQAIHKYLNVKSVITPLYGSPWL
ncbi:hypothetical protein HPP92_008500 [Vanilla planifolia]|uniref:aldehyde dehydrogenase (NAD(+)) n=1 Tax=Vanilla planifolia TaxID=51239 RepID=A0A835RE63_VANPL|nr:hypothetical protein HPP92_008500 [Vanilla planifolia]